MIEFWFNRKKYTIDKGDKVMDNNTGKLQFLPVDDSKRPLGKSGLMRWRKTVYVPAGDWQKMQDKFTLVENMTTHKTYKL